MGDLAVPSTPEVSGAPGERRPPATRARHDLVALRDALHGAEEAVLIARRSPSDPVRVHGARLDLLQAMSRYEAALAECHLPVPPRLRREAHLLRGLLGRERRS